MADVTPILINQLAAQTTLADSDYFIVGGADAKKITVAQMKEALGINELNGNLTPSLQSITDFNNAPDGISIFDSLVDISNSPLGVTNGYLFQQTTQIAGTTMKYQAILSSNGITHYIRIRWYNNWTNWYTFNGNLVLSSQSITDFNNAPDGVFVFDSSTNIANSPGINNGFLFQQSCVLAGFSMKYQVVLGGDTSFHIRTCWYNNWNNWKELQ